VRFRAVCLVAAWALAAGFAPAQPATTTSAPQAAAGAGQAQQVEVVSVTGAAEKLVPAGGKETWQAIRAGEKLSELTILRTGLRAKVVLRFADRAEMTIDRATKVGIGEFRRQGDLTRARVGLKYGTVQAQVHSAAGPNDFQISTPVATLSVRGTGGQAGFTGDMGMGLMGTHGTWQLAGQGFQHSLTAGESTFFQNLGPGFAAWLQMAMNQRGTQMGDAFGGLSPQEIQNLLNNGAGRGLLGFFGSGSGSLQTPPPPWLNGMPQLGRSYYQSHENGYENGYYLVGE